MAPRYTAKQGQYLAFIYYSTKVNGQPPSEAEMQSTTDQSNLRA